MRRSCSTNPRVHDQRRVTKRSSQRQAYFWRASQAGGQPVRGRPAFRRSGGVAAAAPETTAMRGGAKVRRAGLKLGPPPAASAQTGGQAWCWEARGGTEACTPCTKHVLYAGQGVLPHAVMIIVVGPPSIHYSVPQRGSVVAAEATSRSTATLPDHSTPGTSSDRLKDHPGGSRGTCRGSRTRRIQKRSSNHGSDFQE